MKKVILVADDSPSIRKFVSFSLTMQGYEVISACDGMEALEKLPNAKVDLVVTDLNMPNMDGFESIKAIRANPEYEELPIIILSSLSSGKIFLSADILFVTFESILIKRATLDQ